MSHALELTDDTKVMVEYAFGMGRKVMPWADYQDIRPADREDLATRIRTCGQGDHSGDIITIASLLPPSFGHVRTR